MSLDVPGLSLTLGVIDFCWRVVSVLYNCADLYSFLVVFIDVR